MDPNERGPIIAAPNGGPPIECRGIPREHCVSPGTLVEDADLDFGDVSRVIVSCTSARCDAANGELRIDLLMKGSSTTLNYGHGAYGSAP